jgi:hypothetical protein
MGRGGVDSGIFFAAKTEIYRKLKKDNMKKFLLVGLVFMSMTGFTMAQDHHPVHHPAHHKPVHHQVHHAVHHSGHHEPVHHTDHH